MTVVKLPTFHPGQVAAYQLPARFKAVRCGRRWGKTEFGSTVACDELIKKRYVGWFAPDYKRLAETYNWIVERVEPIKIRSARSPQGVIYTKGGGRIDFWTLEDPNAGRGRKYHHAFIDEGAFTKPSMTDTWEKAIRPTLLDYSGRATVLSNTNGVDEENFFWRICNQEKYGFKEYHAPCHQNPYLPADELAKLEADNHPLVYQQEYLAEFVDWSGVAFFDKAKLLVNDAPVTWPSRCDAVFAIVDSATKTGSSNDGTAVVYWAIIKHGHAYQLVCLDWDVVQIEGASLEVWLPTVNQNLEAYAATCKARMGSLGPFIEDKDSGQILLQQMRNKKIPATSIVSDLTALGKDGRAISVSGYVYRGLVKISDVAYNKVTAYKGVTRNHLMTQVLGFRVGDKDAAKRADDLLDGFTYGIALALGNAEGF